MSRRRHFNAAAVGLSGSAHTPCLETAQEEKARENGDEMSHVT